MLSCSLKLICTDYIFCFWKETFYKCPSVHYKLHFSIIKPEHHSLTRLSGAPNLLAPRALFVRSRPPGKRSHAHRKETALLQ